MVDLADIIKNRKFHNADRELLRKFYRGVCSDVQPIIFSRPKWMTEEKYCILMLYFAYVNLCKPAVNRIVSGVYGGSVSRVISDGSPYKDKVDEFTAKHNGYSLKTREWFKSGIMFGSGVNVFMAKEKEVILWQPNPVATEIVSNPNDVTDLEWIIEAFGTGKDRTFKFVNKFAWGSANSQGTITDLQFHGLGIVPAVICYGESNLLFGENEGSGLVDSSVQYSIVVSRLLLNQVALIMNYVSPQAVSSGKVLNENPAEAFEPGGVLEVEQGGSFVFVTPQTNFKDLTATIETYKANFCISEGIPLDALDPSNIPENQSATSARLRNQPLSVTISRLVEEQTANEVKALTIVGALYQFIDTQKEVTYPDFAKRFSATVTMAPSGSTESYAEEAAAWSQLLTMRAKTLEDVVRHFNRGMSEDEIQRRVAKAVQLFDEAIARETQILSPGDPDKETKPEPKDEPKAEEEAA